jgi:hypothetical protein
VELAESGNNDKNTEIIIRKILYNQSLKLIYTRKPPTLA